MLTIKKRHRAKPLACSFLIALSAIITILFTLKHATPAEASQEPPIITTPHPAFTSCAEVTEIPQTECEALVALYNSTDGPNWIYNIDWLQTTTPCDWYGVTCSAGHVFGVILHSNALSGTIPAQIGNLPELDYLQIGDNQLTGPIPPELGNLSKMNALELSFNELTGPIPVEFGNLSDMVVLSMRGNFLTGPIPPGWSTSPIWKACS